MTHSTEGKDERNKGKLIVEHMWRKGNPQSNPLMRGNNNCRVMREKSNPQNTQRGVWSTRISTKKDTIGTIETIGTIGTSIIQCTGGRGGKNQQQNTREEKITMHREEVVGKEFFTEGKEQWDYQPLCTGGRGRGRVVLWLDDCLIINHRIHGEKPMKKNTERSVVGKKFHRGAGSSTLMYWWEGRENYINKHKATMEAHNGVTVEEREGLERSYLKLLDKTLSMEFFIFVGTSSIPL